MKELLSYIVYLAALAFFWYTYNQIKEMPKMITDKLKSEREFEFNKTLQIDEYYRKDGNLSKIMMQWSKYVMDKDSLKQLNTPKGLKEMTDLLKMTIVYGSPQTIKLTSIMFQDIYEKKTDESESGIKMWVMLVMIIVSLKKDFANQIVDPLDIIKIKSNDFEKYKEQYSTCVKEIQKEIGE